MLLQPKFYEDAFAQHWTKLQRKSKLLAFERSTETINSLSGQMWMLIFTRCAPDLLCMILSCRQAARCSSPAAAALCPTDPTPTAVRVVFVPETNKAGVQRLRLSRVRRSCRYMTMQPWQTSLAFAPLQPAFTRWVRPCTLALASWP